MIICWQRRSESGEDFGEDVGGFEGGESGEVNGVVAEDAVEEQATFGAVEAEGCKVGETDARETDE